MSKLEDLFRTEIRSPVAAIAIICGIVLVLPAIYWGWPVGAYLALTVVLIYALRCKQNLFAKAAVSLLKPIAIGLGLAVLVALYLNAAYVPDHTDEQAVRRFEEAVLALAAQLSLVSKLPLLCLVGLYLFLAFLAIRFPRFRLVQYVGTGRRYLGLTAGVLATLASVTFFSATALDHRAATARSRITAQYRKAKEREAKLVAKYLALCTTAESLHTLTSAEQQFYRHIFDFMYIHYSSEAVDVASLSGRGLLESTRRVYIKEEPEEEEKEVVNSYGALDAERDRKKHDKPAREDDIDQAREALKKAISEIIGASTGALRDIAFAWFESAAAAAHPDLMTQIKKYVGRISDDSLEEKLKPHLDRAADNLARRLQELVPRNRPGQANTLESSLVEADKIISNTCKNGADEVRREAKSQPGTESALRLDAALLALGAIKRTPFHSTNSGLSETIQNLEQTKAKGATGRGETHEPPRPPRPEPRPRGRR